MRSPRRQLKHERSPQDRQSNRELALIVYASNSMHGYTVDRCMADLAIRRACLRRAIEEVQQAGTLVLCDWRRRAVVEQRYGTSW